MTINISSQPRIDRGSLLVRDRSILTGVPESVVVNAVGESAAFIGAKSQDGQSSRLVFTLGVLEEYRFLCLFRFKIWWMIPRMGNSGSDLPVETQMLLLEAKECSIMDETLPNPSSKNTFYVLLLPVLESNFRASLQGNSADELQLCVESGDSSVVTSEALESLFICSGDYPYDLIRSSIKLLADYKGTFNHLENKKTPTNLDWFGWCTWDAFYDTVNPQGIVEGLQSLSEGGCPAKFLIIDDGWQNTANEFCKEGEPFSEGTQFARRLVDIKENNNFQSSSSFVNLEEFICSIKEKYDLKCIYMWHALLGYWGGLDPSSEAMKKYHPKIVYPIQSPGNVGNLRDIAMDSLEKYGVGLVDPDMIYEFYNDLHGYLFSKGIDGVKVDIQNVIETLGSGYGGRVSLTRQYHQALELSVTRNFGNNNLICCMSHNSDYIFSSKKSSTARASEDFMPRQPTLQTLHVASVSFNSLLLGEIVVPDWDMFQSSHETAEFHGAARALGGCAVYVSDKPGEHDFKVLRKLVLPDGSILRAKHAGRPTHDCLFNDPVMNRKSLLKIWNLNKFTGVIGVFNCQGAGCWQLQKEHDICSSRSVSLSGKVSPSDVEYIEDLAGEDWTGDHAVYTFNSGSLSRLPATGQLSVSLSKLQSEIYTITPIKVYYQILEFAPLGLIDMFNSGGAVEDVSCFNDLSGLHVNIKSKGCGRFGAYSSIKPSFCTVDGINLDFDYSPGKGFLIIKLPTALSTEISTRDIEIVYTEGVDKTSTVLSTEISTRDIEIVYTEGVDKTSTVLSTKINIRSIEIL